MTYADRLSDDLTKAIGAPATRSGMRWSQEEDDFLRANYKTLGAKRVGKSLGRSKDSVRARVRTLKAAPRRIRRWTPEEYDFLEEHYETRGLKYVSEQLGRSESTVYSRAHALGLKQPRPPRQTSWSKVDDDILREFYQSMTAYDLGEVLGRSRAAVQNRAQYLGLRKNAKRRAL